MFAQQNDHTSDQFVVMCYATACCENNYVNYFFFQHDIDNNNDCNYAMYCCNVAVCRSEAVATLYYTHTRARTHTHTHTRARAQTPK